MMEDPDTNVNHHLPTKPKMWGQISLPPPTAWGFNTGSRQR